MGSRVIKQATEADDGLGIQLIRLPPLAPTELAEARADLPAPGAIEQREDDPGHEPAVRRVSGPGPDDTASVGPAAGDRILRPSALRPETRAP